MEVAARVSGCDARGDLLCVEAARRSASVAVGSEARALLRIQHARTPHALRH
jgi:hypothetical protein